MKRILLLIPIFFTAVALYGCSNPEIDNPVSPEKMAAEASKQDRGNFQPKGGPAPATTAGQR